MSFRRLLFSTSSAKIEKVVNMPLNFAYSRIRSRDPGYREIYQNLLRDESILDGAEIWGAFHGLFGIASNEFIVVTMGNVSGIGSRLYRLRNLHSHETHFLEPTVRPLEYEPRTREGLYVFRFFRVDNNDVNQIAELSATAWQWFENADNYRAEPQALFCEQDRSSAEGRMLLCTWYDDLNSWMTSRQPAPEASENFRQRGELTLRTKAYATRLIVP